MHGAAKVLLVDDEPGNLQALRSSLATCRCECVLAQSAEEALVALLEQDFAAIILDVGMPGVDGIELAELIRRRRRGERVPLVLVSEPGTEDLARMRGYAAGAVDWLIKPINPRVIRSKVAVFVELHHASRQLELLNRTLDQRVEQQLAALRATEHRKNQLLAAVAHELRNPLAALCGAVRMLSLKAHGRELAEPQEVMKREIDRIMRLIHDLLDVSHLSTGRLGLRRKRVELRQLLAAAVEGSQPVIDHRGHSLTMDLPSDPVWLDADGDRLGQVFEILLENAARYTEPAGNIRLSARSVGTELTVVVEDSGIGIAVEKLPCVFELFEKCHDRADLAPGGLGISLTIARRLVELHGGTITADSPGLGKGSTFIVRVPAPAVAEHHSHQTAA